MTRGARIKNAREQAGLSQIELAERIAVTKQNMYKYENDIITNIPSDKIEAIANALHTTPAYIMGWESDVSKNIKIEPLPQMKKIPLLGKVACGEPIYCEEKDWFSIPKDIQADFCLRCKGDSMINARINDGDIVFIHSCPEVENGQIAAVAIDNEVTLKRVYYYPQKNKRVLNPENPKYEPYVYTGEELNDIRIIGRAVVFLSGVK